MLETPSCYWPKALSTSACHEPKLPLFAITNRAPVTLVARLGEGGFDQRKRDLHRRPGAWEEPAWAVRDIDRLGTASLLA